MAGQGDFELFSTESVYQEGLDLLEADHLEEALRAFDYVIERQPSHADAFFHRGIALMNLGRGEDGAASLRRAVDLCPAEASYLSHYGYALLISGQVDAAIERFEMAHSLHPDDPQTKIYMACALAEKRQLGRARALLEEVLEQNPRSIEALRQHSALAAMLGDEDAALRDIHLILQEQPNNLETLHRLAEIHQNANRRAEAIRALRQIVAIDPSDGPAWLELVRLSLETGNRAAVIAHATEAISAGIRDAEIYQHRGRAYLEQRRVDQAITDLRHARDLDDQSVGTHYWLARAYVEAGRLRQALYCAGRALQISPRDRRIIFLKAQLHRQLGELESEHQYLKTLQAGQPLNFEITRLLVRNYLARHKPGAALATVDAFLHRKPNHMGALLLCAELSEAHGDPAQAVWCYRQVLRQPRAEARAHTAFADFLMRQSDTPGAAAVLEAAAELFPGDLSVLLRQAEVLQRLARFDESVTILEQALRDHRPTPDMYWVLGKGLYAMQRYDEALEAFHAARDLETRCNGTAAPSFRCLVAEVCTLHHLGRTGEGVRLLEKHFTQFEHFERECHELLGELYEQMGEPERARRHYEHSIEKFGESAAVRYRLARCAASLNLKALALHHLGAAIRLDPSLAETASNEPVFQRYVLSLSMQRLMQFRGLRRHAGALAGLAAIATAALAAIWLIAR
jgi:tetratricopeptide (TPR) repeat protein